MCDYFKNLSISALCGIVLTAFDSQNPTKPLPKAFFSGLTLERVTTDERHLTKALLDAVAVGIAVKHDLSEDLTRRDRRIGKPRRLYGVRDLAVSRRERHAKGIGVTKRDLVADTAGDRHSVGDRALVTEQNRGKARKAVVE